MDGLDEVHQPPQATPIPTTAGSSGGLNTHGGYSDGYSERPFRGGQLPGFETPAEKKERRVKLEWIMAESEAREAYGREG